MKIFLLAFLVSCSSMTLSESRQAKAPEPALIEIRDMITLIQKRSPEIYHPSYFKVGYISLDPSTLWVCASDTEVPTLYFDQSKFNQVPKEQKFNVVYQALAACRQSLTNNPKQSFLRI